MLSLGAIVWPGALGWMNSKATVDKVYHALTETNSGSTVKDALNRIEQHQEEQGRR